MTTANVSINLNTATPEKLREIPGIGDARSKVIVRLREIAPITEEMIDQLPDEGLRKTLHVGLKESKFLLQDPEAANGAAVDQTKDLYQMVQQIWRAVVSIDTRQHNLDTRLHNMEQASNKEHPEQAGDLEPTTREIHDTDPHPKMDEIQEAINRQNSRQRQSTGQAGHEMMEQAFGRMSSVSRASQLPGRATPKGADQLRGDLMDSGRNAQKGWRRKIPREYEDESDTDSSDSEWSCDEAQNLRKQDNMSLPTYDGKTKWQGFEEQLRAIMRRKPWSNREKCDRVCEALRGEALEYFASLSRTTKKDFKKLIKKLRYRFGDRVEPALARRAGHSMRQNVDETLHTFAQRVSYQVQAGYRDSPKRLK